MWPALATVPATPCRTHQGCWHAMLTQREQFAAQLAKAKQVGVFALLPGLRACSMGAESVQTLVLKTCAE